MKKILILLAFFYFKPSPFHWECDITVVSAGMFATSWVQSNSYEISWIIVTFSLASVKRQNVMEMPPLLAVMMKIASKA